MTIAYVGAERLGKCPAAVNMISGEIIINQDVWDKFTKYEQAFIIEHEKGHYLIPTDFEKEADAYALKKTYKTTPNALKHAIDALLKMDVTDKTRINALYNEILNIENMRTKQKNNSFFGENPTKPKSKPIIPKRNKPKRKINRADGEEVEEKKVITTTTYGRSHKKNGFVIGGVYLSITNMLLFGLLFVSVITAFRVGKS